MARHDTTRMILYAAARVLGCGSVQMTQVDEERRSLIFTTSITNRDLPRLYEVESQLGFPLEGAALPLDTEDSIVVRAFREGRLILSDDVAELAGRAVPPEAIVEIRKTIGRRSFAAAPIAGSAGVLGVLIFEKRGDAGFSADDRDLIIAYADRVGADQESQALSDDVKHLESLATRAGEAASYQTDRSLMLAGGRSLWDEIGLPARVTVAAHAGGLKIAVEDLAESERLRQEAARVREHLAKVLRSVADVILTLDANGRVASGNETMAQAFGYQPIELTKRDAL